MVPADDEHKSTNEAEKNASTQKTFFEKLKFWKRCKINGEPAPLQPLPDCLMKWKAPVWIAVAGFFIALPFAIIWRGTPHWPSAEAMKLCATIAGAGFAFSAWQQRSHDNAVNAKQAQVAIERDDYWKRREHIYQLLGSENPGLRLSAVALLAELADSAAHSNLLNEIEKQQLQRHIIDTLCLQVRREGLNQTHEGTPDEHAEIQNAILQVILERIRDAAPANYCANWSEQTIKLSNSKFLTPLTIKDIQTKATLDLQQSTFSKGVKICKSKLKTILWGDANFDESIDIGSKDYETEIGIDSIPKNITEAYFTNCNIITREILSIDFSQRNQNGTHFPELNFEKCTFRTTSCECTRTCGCQHTDIHINNADKYRDLDQQTTTLTFKMCTFHSLYLYFTTISSKLEILGNTIHNQLSIDFMTPEDAKDSVDRLFAADARIAIRDNKLVKSTQTRPIQITAECRQRISSILQVGNNIAMNPNDALDERVITCSLLDENPLTFHFKEDSASTPPLFNPWNTGQLTPPSSEIDNTATRWRLVTPFKAFHSLSKRFKNLDHTTRSS